MKRLTSSGLLGLALPCALALGACAGSPDGDGRGLTIAVAPLTLPGVTDACYTLTVTAEGGETVWSQAEVCADQYGDGASDITYIGTCDATDGPDADSVATNTVTLTIDALYAADGSDADSAPDLLADWENPCAAPHNPGGCQLTAPCRENADSPVAFNLTLMRQANQGFFDVAVNFDDIFCSAKVDCTLPDGGPLRLVFDAAGNRVDTVVMALACTDGDAPGTGVDAAQASTHLYLDDLELVCDDDANVGDDLADATPPKRYLVDPSAGPGNLYPGGAGAPAPLVQAMVFEGRERLANGTGAAGSADKVYWNVALGLQASVFTATTTPAYSAPHCHLRTRATASKGPLAGGVTPADTNYPYLDVDVVVSDASGATCTRHPLASPSAATGVAIRYTGNNADGSGFASRAFAHEAVPSADSVATGTVVPGFVRVPRGRFLAGPDVYGLDAQYPVTLTYDFWLQQTEVSQAEWTATFAALAALPVHPSWAATAVNPSSHVGPTLPVERASFFDVLAFANARSLVAGRTPCYDLSACAGTVGVDFACGESGPGSANVVPPFVGLACDGYRLPTDAEWEYAARADDTTAEPPAADFAWMCASNLDADCYDPNFGFDPALYAGETHPVGTKLGNAWGLRDMLGNVYELTNDISSQAAAVPATDPDHYFEPIGWRLRSVRGFSYYDPPPYVNARDRVWADFGAFPANLYRDFSAGFRLVRKVD